MSPCRKKTTALGDNREAPALDPDGVFPLLPLQSSFTFQHVEGEGAVSSLFQTESETQVVWSGGGGERETEGRPGLMWGKRD